MDSKEKKTLLLVEDDLVLAMGETINLETYGYKVVTATSGEEAIETIKNTSNIDLILMDINLGNGIDGTEAAKLILKNHDIPIIFLSSHTEPEVVEKTEKITSYGYVVKSASMTVLDASIKMAFKLFEANKKIVKNEIKQKAMIANISDVIGIIGSDSIIKYKSPNIEKWFGWKPEDFIGRNGWMTVHPDDLERIKKEFYNILEKDNLTTTLTYRYKCKNGSYKPIELTATNLVNNPEINGILINYHDITARQKAEELLRHNEARLNEAQQIAHLGSWETDLKTGESVWSNEMYHIMGIDPETSISIDTINKIVHPEDLEIFTKKIEEAIAKKKVNSQHKYRIIRPNGEVRWVESEGRLIYDSEGDAIKFLGTELDITEHQRVEDTLCESENIIRKKLKAILEPQGDITTLDLADIIDSHVLQSMMGDFYNLTNIGSAVVDLSGKVLVEVGWQDVCKKFHRNHPETLKNCIQSDTSLSNDVPIGEFKAYHCKNNLWDVVTPIEVAGKHLGNIFIGQFFYKDEILDYDLFRKQAAKYSFDEEEYLAAIEKVPRWSKETVEIAMKFYSKLAGIISSLSYSAINLSRSLTQQKRALVKLEESESKLQQAQYIAKIGDFTWDINTGKTIWSDGMYRLLKYEKNDKIDYEKVNESIHHPDDLERVTKWLMDSIASGSEFLVPNEYRLIRKDGKIIYVETNGQIEYKNGKALKVFGTCQDITERKKSEEQIKKQLSEKEIILKEIHHRIKNNITSIEIMLLMESKAIRNHEAIAILQDAIGRVSSMRVLYDKLLISEDYKEISVKSYIESLITTIIATFPTQTKIKIKKRIEDFKLFSNQLFPIGIIINELLTNAIKYAFTDIDEGLININLTKTKNHVRLTLHNNGIEIPDDFDINDQKGFGLMLVRLLTEQLDGNFTIEKYNGTRSILKFDI